jgi:predicted metal-binding membrane protein
MSVVGRRAAAVGEWSWAHPEWWVVALGALAWVPVARHGLRYWGHAFHHRASFAIELAYWHAMVLAMMLPIIAMKARDVAFRTLAWRRHRAIALFLIGYLIPWSAFGVVAVAIRSVSPASPRWLVTAAFAGAMVWALLPIRERAMVWSYGHAPVVAPTGREADRDCIGTGLIVGGWCVVSCWALMLACVLSGHDLVAMTIGASIGIAEALSFRPPRLFVLVSSAALIAFFALFAVAGR